jgi:hypothetical protein
MTRRPAQPPTGRARSEAYRDAETGLADKLERAPARVPLLHGTGPTSAVVRRAASRLGLGGAASAWSCGPTRSRPTSEVSLIRCRLSTHCWTRCW